MSRGDTPSLSLCLLMALSELGHSPDAMSAVRGQADGAQYTHACYMPRDIAATGELPPPLRSSQRLLLQKELIFAPVNSQRRPCMKARARTNPEAIGCQSGAMRPGSGQIPPNLPSKSGWALCFLVEDQPLDTKLPTHRNREHFPANKNRAHAIREAGKRSATGRPQGRMSERLRSLQSASPRGRPSGLHKQALGPRNPHTSLSGLDLYFVVAIGAVDDVGDEPGDCKDSNDQIAERPEVIV